MTAKLRRALGSIGWLWILLAMLGGSRALAATEELKIDGFESGQAVDFGNQFISGEIGAVRLVPTLSCPCTIERLTFLFGPDETPDTLTLRIWEDPDGQVDPGTEIYEASVSLTGSSTAFHEVDLPGDGVVVDGPFRVGFEFTAVLSGPSLARDTDGTLTPGGNFVLACTSDLLTCLFGVPTFAWSRGEDIPGFDGDFVIRATVTTPPQCSDGIDNDGDGKVDYPADPNCKSASGESEALPPPPPPTCGLGGEAVLLLAPLLGRAVRRRSSRSFP